jgi:Uma2 family endonuclease
MPVSTLEPRFLRFPFGQTGQFLRLRGGLDLTDRQGFGVFCDDNPEWRIERSATGELSVEMPTKGMTGNWNAYLGYLLFGWALQEGSGIAFDSSTGFALPSGAMRSPDAAWIRKSQLDELTDEEKQEVIFELRSSSDQLGTLEDKMQEWRDAGVRLGVLIDPEAQTVHLFRPGVTPVVLTPIRTLENLPELPGFSLDLAPIFTNL